MDTKTYAKLSTDIMRETAAASKIIRSVYTGQKSDAELGKALDALANVLPLLEPHEENSAWYNRLREDVMQHVHSARALVRFVYTGEKSDTELGKALDHITSANIAVDQQGYTLEDQ